jgi:hypothetical protein
MTDVWRDPSYTAGPMKSLVVFGGRMNATNRRTLEDGLVSALAQRGVHATASYTLFPELPSKDVARAAMQQLAADGYLVASMRGTSERRSSAGGGYGGTGFGGVFWDDFYGAGWGEGWGPGYVVTNEFVKFQTSLWDGNGGRLVWSATTETENPSSGKDFTKSLLKKIIPGLAHAGFVLPEQGRDVSYAQSVTAPQQ